MKIARFFQNIPPPMELPKTDTLKIIAYLDDAAKLYNDNGALLSLIRKSRLTSKNFYFLI